MRGYEGVVTCIEDMEGGRGLQPQRHHWQHHLVLVESNHGEAPLGLHSELQVPLTEVIVDVDRHFELVAPVILGHEANADGLGVADAQHPF